MLNYELQETYKYTVGKMQNYWPLKQMVCIVTTGFTVLR
jgi:hypothetical protein